MLAAIAVLVPLMAFAGSGVTQRLSVGGFVVPEAESTQVADILEHDFGTGTYTFALILMPKDKWVYHELNRPEGQRITAAIQANRGCSRSHRSSRRPIRRCLRSARCVTSQVTARSSA